MTDEVETHSAGAPGHHTPAAGKAKDPVCGMSVDPEKTPHRHEHAGRLYHFCGAQCREKFALDPERYLKPPASDPETSPLAAPPISGVIYTCPMHPEIRQPGPGACPICGMALEPLNPAEAGPNPELADMSRRFWIGLAAAAMSLSSVSVIANALRLRLQRL